MIGKSNLPMLFKALSFAADKHRGQKRKDDCTPYINHPIALSNLLVNEGCITDTDILCAALLHDLIEDTPVKPEELKELFGELITDIVVEVTDDKDLDKPVRKLAQVNHAPYLSKAARAVKLADKICNLRDVVESPPTRWPLERRQEYFAWSKRVIDGLRGDWPNLEDLFDQEYEAGLSTLIKGN